MVICKKKVSNLGSFVLPEEKGNINVFMGRISDYRKYKIHDTDIAKL